MMNTKIVHPQITDPKTLAAFMDVMDKEHEEKERARKAHWLYINEAAQLANVSRGVIRRWIDKNRIYAIRRNNQWMINRLWLEDFLWGQKAA